MPYDSEDEPLYGEISGRVIDSQSKAPLSNVNIVILDSNYGAASAMDGTYLIRKIPPGSYVLKISSVGFYHGLYFGEFFGRVVLNDFGLFA